MSRAAVLGASLVLLPAAFVTWAARPDEVGRSGERLGSKIPAQIGAWQGIDEPLDDATVRMLRTDDYVNRRYEAAGLPAVDLTIVFSRRERKTVHPPEICLEAQGWEPEGREETVIEGVGGANAADGVRVPAASLHLVRERARLEVLYWYTTGGDATPSWSTHQWNVAWAVMRGEEPGSAMVRLMCRTTAGEPRTLARETLDSFAREALPHLAHAFD